MPLKYTLESLERQSDFSTGYKAGIEKPNGENYDVYICAGDALDKRFLAQFSHNVITDLWRPPLLHQRTLMTLKSLRNQEVLFLFIVTRKEGEGLSLLAGRLVGVVGCVCSKLPIVYSHQTLQGGGGML